MQFLQIVIARLSTRQRRRPWQPKDVVPAKRTSLGCRGAQRCRVAHLAMTNRRFFGPCAVSDGNLNLAPLPGRPFPRPQRW